MFPDKTTFTDTSSPLKAETVCTETFGPSAARYVGQRGAAGVKLHLLHILRGTPMEAEYAEGHVRTLELDEYITLLERCLAVLPPEVVIHRLTGDAPKRDLIAPPWSADKSAS